MNNTTKKTILSLVAIFIAAALIVGSFVATTTTKTAFAANNNSGNTVTAQINRQHSSGSGFDNDPEQEAQNTICTHPGENSACVQEGAAAPVTPKPTPTPVNKTCEECFTSILNSTEIGILLNSIKGVSSVADLCALLESGQLSTDTVIVILRKIGTSETTLKDLLACLKDAGIVITG